MIDINSYPKTVYKLTYLAYGTYFAWMIIYHRNDFYLSLPFPDKPV